MNNARRPLKKAEKKEKEMLSGCEEKYERVRRARELLIKGRDGEDDDSTNSAVDAGIALTK